VFTTCTVTINVRNILGNLVNGAVVTAITKSGDSVATVPAGTTGPLANPNGEFTFTVNWTVGGSIQFDTGNLPPITVSFS
jgi:hypothetical protein